ncbi:MAG: hypothetical protein L0312_02805 [Acidobacteria bacterium]|nr:hypothetical protein [Acidobacteriota bacterium]
MPDTKKWNPYESAADALRQRKKDIDEASEEKPKKDDRPKKSEADPDRDPAEERELMKSTPRLWDYRIRKNIGSATPAEIRLYELQEKRAQPAKKGVPSYKKGTKNVPRTGFAKLHKGEAVIPAKQAKKYRGRKVKAAASALGAGKHKKPVKKKPMC